MKRYKLVRIVGEECYSANTRILHGGLKYKVGEETYASGKGVACYDTLKHADTPEHVDETMNFFNQGNPVAILEVKSLGRRLPDVNMMYGKDDFYEGGVNYQAILVVRVVKTYGVNYEETPNS